MRLQSSKQAPLLIIEDSPLLSFGGSRKTGKGGGNILLLLNPGLHR